MSVTIRRQRSYRPWSCFPPITWPHFRVGVKVKIIAPGYPHLKAWKQGDTGVVLHVLPTSRPGEIHPDDDFYLVRLDTPRIEGRIDVGFKFKEIAENADELPEMSR